MRYAPCVVVLTGPPLHGKTVVGKALTVSSNILEHDVDLIKAGVLTDAARARGETYDFSKGTAPEVLAGCYQLTVDLGRATIGFERPTILTGTFSKPEFKAPLLEWMAGEARKAMIPGVDAIPFRVFRLNVGSYDTIAQRIEQRIVEGHPSSIKSREKYEKSLTLASPWPDGVEVTDIDADRPLEEVVAEIRSKISDLAWGF